MEFRGTDEYGYVDIIRNSVRFGLVIPIVKKEIVRVFRRMVDSQYKAAKRGLDLKREREWKCSYVDCTHVHCKAVITIPI